MPKKPSTAAKQTPNQNIVSEKVSISPMQTIDRSMYAKKDKRPSIEVARSVEQHGSSLNLIFKKPNKENVVSINQDLEIDSHRVFSSYQNVIFRKSIDQVSLAYKHLKRKTSQENLISSQ